MHSEQYPWKEIVSEGQFKTWVPVAVSEGFKVTYCFGKKPTKAISFIDSLNETMRWNKGAKVSDFRNMINRILASPFKKYIPPAKNCKIPGFPVGVEGLEVKLLDLYATGRWKQLALINYFLNETSCKYLVISTSTTYLKTKVLLKVLGQLEGPYVYSGPLYGAPQERFVSGAQIVIDRDFASDIIQFRNKIPTYALNDLGLGVLATRLMKQPSELPTLNIGNLKELDTISPEQLATNYHYRLKSIDEITGKRNDIDIFLRLHEMITNGARSSINESGEF